MGEAQGTQASVVASIVWPWYSWQSFGFVVQIPLQKNRPEAHIVQLVVRGPVHHWQEEWQGSQVRVAVFQ